jgi:FMN phosphatase YigB (HAD superfamily)/lambda repressor-like predicted transcriptional regulator
MEEKKLGEIVQQARRAHGLTQQALCQKTGLSYSTLAKIERGAIKSPSVFTIGLIASCLGVSLDELMSAVLPRGGKKKGVSQNGVRFVYFDMNGCLVRSFSNAFARLAEESGASQETVETVFWKYSDDVNRGVKSVDELNTALAERLGVMVDWNKYYLEAIQATPFMAELVHWVGEHYQIGILTNTMPHLVQPMLDAGLLPVEAYDAIVESCDVHALKPEHRMYEIAAERAGVEPHEILLIDDDRPNLTAAGREGWHTMKFHAFQPEESIEAIRTALQPAR